MESTDPEAIVTRLVTEYATPLSLTDLLCDRHAGQGRVALLWEDPERRQELTFDELGTRAANVAAVLTAQGVEHGDRVAVLLPRSPDLLVALLAVWRLGAVHVPLFTAFGPDAVAHRIAHCGAKAVITDQRNRAKVEQPDAACTILCVGAGRPGDLDFTEAADTPATPPAPRVSGPDDPFILLYTSGTTGKPKGVPVPLRALASFHAYMHFGLDLRPDDVFWNVSDPGWGYGLWFGVVGPLLLGHTTILRDVAFDPADSLRAIERLGVTNLTGAPTFYRRLREHGVGRGFAARTALRAVSSAGEPLSPELLAWSREALGTPIHDHYGQSEIGMAIGYPHHPSVAVPPRPAAMGRSFPGYRAIVIAPDGTEAHPGTPGNVAIDIAASPLYWFTGYLRAPERTAERFPAGPHHYLTGDTAERADDGIFTSAGRSDDVITSSGYRIGPFDVETVLLTHPDVTEAAVFGVPDPIRGEVVTAALVLRDGAEPSTPLVTELQDRVRERLGRHLHPRRIHFMDVLPRTPSGKIQRNLLRRRFAANGEPASLGS